jgi:chromosome segregation ATPase
LRGVKEWSEPLSIVVTAFSTLGGVELVRWIITRWSSRNDAELIEQAKLRQEERDQQRVYYTQLREDYQQLRDEHRLLHTTVMAIEKAHRECEEILIKVERENAEIRQKAQVTQLRYDEMAGRMETLQMEYVALKKKQQELIDEGNA